MSDNYCATCEYPLERDGTCRPCWKDRIYAEAIDGALSSAKVPLKIKRMLEAAITEAREYD